MKLIATLFITQVMAATVSCPAISCDTTISGFTCFEHSDSTPVESISTWLCPDDQTCNVDF